MKIERTMKSARILAAAVLVALATSAVAANDEWIGKAVRIQYDADETALVPGKVVRTGGCLYVRLDAERDGLTLIRLDQVSRLQVQSGGAWRPQDVKTVLAREPAQCLEEANG